jgi:hypothetical protein
VRTRLSLTFALLATGCAFSNLEVHPPAALPPQAGARGPGRGREIIVHAPFADARYEDRCGMQKNGYNMDTADVRCTTAPGHWLADALAAELARAGFTPLRADAVPGPTTAVVHGTVHQLFIEPTAGFWTVSVEGDVAVRLVVTSADGLHAERTFFVKGAEQTVISLEETFQDVADAATRKIARAMVAGLTELLDHYPALGVPSAGAPVAAVAPRSP